MLQSLSPGSRQKISDSISTKFYERRVVVESGSVKTVILSVGSDSEIVSAWIPNSIVIVKGRWNIRLIIFESNSHLTRIESKAFSESSLESILIPKNVEILGSECFSYCKSLSSITFESNSHLTRIESEAFHKSSLESILIPSTVSFIGSDAVDIASEIRLIDGDSCPEFDRWLQLRQSGILIDFRRIQKLGFDVPSLEGYIVNLSEFEERSIICNSNELPNEIYDRIEDQFLVCMKSKPLSENVEESQIKN
jgi:hypothetical protein